MARVSDGYVLQGDPLCTARKEDGNMCANPEGGREETQFTGGHMRRWLSPSG